MPMLSPGERVRLRLQRTKREEFTLRITKEDGSIVILELGSSESVLALLTRVETTHAVVRGED